MCSRIGVRLRWLRCYAWEESLETRVKGSRAEELKQLKRNKIVQALNMFMINSIPIAVTFTTFLVYVAAGNQLTAAVAFTALSLFSVLRMPLMTLPNSINSAIQAGVSLDRIQGLLSADTLKDEGELAPAVSGQTAIRVEKSNYNWSTTGTATLKNFELEIVAGNLVTIVGSTGSGKSSVLSAILGEMMPPVNTPMPTVRGTVSYVSQQAWIFNATLRENILFGRPYDTKRYQEAIRVSALKRDFDLMVAGDMTEIGEKGVNLSGGQKQRVSIARAVYADSNVVLLDDPLSALDAHVAKDIFEECFKRYLKGKTIVFVTNRLEFVAGADRVIMMDEGRIVADGLFEDLRENNTLFRELVGENSTANDAGTEDASGLTSAPAADDENAKKSAEVSPGVGINADESDVAKSEKQGEDSRGTLIKVEKKESGSISSALILTYAKAMGGISVLVLILGTFIIIEGARLGASLWISYWADTQSSGDADKKGTFYYIGIYGAISGGQTVMTLANLLIVAFASVRAGRALHGSMITTLLRAPMSFFNATPLGRIINRVSKDMSFIDRMLATACTIFLRGLIQIVGTLIIIGISTPYTLVSFVPMITMFWFTYRYFQESNRELKRLDSIARSPIYAYFEQCLGGLSTIRAYRAEGQVAAVSAMRLDRQQRMTLALFSANRWLSIRLEILGGLMILFCAVFLVAGSHVVNPGTIGLALSYALQITGLLNMTVRLAAVAENGFNAVERVKEYIEVDSEAVEAPEGAPKPPRDWPSHGKIEFDDVSMKYRPDLPPVLNNLDFTAEAGQKIGIVGRTGAGKSSTFLTLFRICEASTGTIKIDGIDISQLSMHALRSKLSIIPQDPVLFTGSVRFNLDPFGQFDDQVLWNALERSHLVDFVKSRPDGLEELITDGGENFSVGQRQLLCLARALVRHSSILVLDEATAAVDVQTDALIQKTIREEFASCTVLAIAHRLNTIIDSDRILVLDAGSKVEYGTPAELLSKKGGEFASMVDDTGADNARFLRDVATGRVDMKAHIERVASENVPNVSPRMSNIASISSVQFSAPEMEQTRKALLKVKGALFDTTSRSWSAALDSQEITEEQWLSDLKLVLEQLVVVATTRLERFNIERSEDHDHQHVNRLSITLN